MTSRSSSRPGYRRWTELLQASNKRPLCEVDPKLVQIGSGELAQNVAGDAVLEQFLSVEWRWITARSGLIYQPRGARLPGGLIVGSSDLASESTNDRPRLTLGWPADVRRAATPSASEPAGCCPAGPGSGLVPSGSANGTRGPVQIVFRAGIQQLSRGRPAARALASGSVAISPPAAFDLLWKKPCGAAVASPAIASGADLQLWRADAPAPLHLSAPDRRQESRCLIEINPS